MATRNPTPDPTVVYDECIVQNPRICNNCFRRYKDVEDPPDPDNHDFWERHAIRTRNGASHTTLKQITTRKTVRATTDGTIVNAYEIVNRHGRREKAARPAWVCAACGAIDGTADPRARDTQQLMAAAKRLCDRLGEAGVDADRDALLDMARELKESPDATANEFELLERAVEAGLAPDDQSQ